MKRLNLIQLLLLLVVIDFSSGCTKRHGVYLDANSENVPNISKEIRRGMTQGDVEQALGDPSVVALNGTNQETWVYERYAGGCVESPPQVLRVLDISHNRSSSWEDLKLGDKPLSVKITFDSESKVDSFSYEPSRH